MKLIPIICLAFCLQVSTGGDAQTVSLSEKNGSLKKVFGKLQKQTGYTFLYSLELLAHAKKITVTLRHVSLQQALDTCFKDQPFTYKLLGRMIVIKEKSPVAAKEAIYPQRPIATAFHKVQGRVADSAETPLVGATVAIRGTQRVTQTDARGHFSMENATLPLTLMVSYTGYGPLECKVQHENDILIILSLQIHPLEEVYTNGYGQTSRRFGAGSMRIVSSKDLEQQSVTNPLAALEGAVAGLVVTTRSGIPGSSYTVQIRGQNTLRQDLNATHLLTDEPLFVIDGVPFGPQNENLNQFQSLLSPSNGTGTSLYNSNKEGLSPLNLINLADIESIAVLRDAASTSIYGSRGSNGVILITTQKGKAGKIHFSTTVSSGESKSTRVPQLLDRSRYLQMRKEALASDGVPASPTAPGYYSDGFAPDLLVFDTTRATDWVHYFLGGTAPQTAVHSSLSGGSETIQYLAAAGFNRSGYITPGNFSESRTTLHTRLQYHSPNRCFSFDFSAGYTSYQNHSSASASALTAFAMEPDEPALVDNRGGLVWKYKDLSLSDTRFGNPFSYLKTTYFSHSDAVLSSLVANYQIRKGLRLLARLGYHTTLTREYAARPLSSMDSSLSQGSSAQLGTSETPAWLVEPQIAWKTQIGQGSLQVVAGSNREYRHTIREAIAASGYTNDSLLGSVSPANATQVSYTDSRYRYDGLFGWINYVWKDAYVVDFTGRRDGSSRFARSGRFANFGSVAAGWIFSEEPLVKKSLRFLHYGKLSLSWGTSGNDNIGDDPDPSVDDSTHPFSWGITQKWNAGLELAFLHPQVLIHIDAYRNVSGNQLVELRSGQVSVLQNETYRVRNSGWEVTVVSQPIEHRHFTWNFSFNLSIPSNRLLAFPGIENSNYASTYVVGQSLQVIQAVPSIGVNPSTGLFQYRAADGTPTYAPVLTSASRGGDKVVTGNRDARFYGGLSNTLSYAHWAFTVFLQFSQQNGPNYLSALLSNTAAGMEGNVPAVLLASYWRQPGDQVPMQRLTSSIHTPAYRTAGYFSSSSGAYSDASYLRCKSISLGYAVAGKMLRHLKLATCRLYLSGDNLFTLSRYMGDPETQSYYGVPPLKTVVAGIQCSF